MLIITKKQVAAFEQAAADSFESQMVRHLRSLAPRQLRETHESSVRQAIRHGLSRSAQYGFTNRGPVRFYLKMMLLFGSAFDTDPQVPWAAGALESGDVNDQMERADQLYETTLEYLGKVPALDTARALEVLRSVSMASTPAQGSSARLEDSALAQMERLRPQKCAHLGNEALQALIQKGISMAQAQLLLAPHAVTLLILVMFIFGHGFARDPLLPWFARALEVPPAQQAQRPEARLLACSSEALSHWQGW